MPNHRQLQEWLAIYRELDARQRRQVDDHLRHCGDCQATLAAYAGMDRNLRNQIQTHLQLVATQPLALPSISIDPAAWLDDLLFRVRQLRPVTFRLAAATALLLLVMALSTLFGNWLSFEQPVMASTPTQMAAQSTQSSMLDHVVALTYTPTATPTAISLAVTITPVAIQ